VIRTITWVRIPNSNLTTWDSSPSVCLRWWLDAAAAVLPLTSLAASHGCRTSLSSKGLTCCKAGAQSYGPRAGAWFSRLRPNAGSPGCRKGRRANRVFRSRNVSGGARPRPPAFLFPKIRGPMHQTPRRPLTLHQSKGQPRNSRSGRGKRARPLASPLPISRPLLRVPLP